MDGRKSKWLAAGLLVLVGGLFGCENGQDKSALWDENQELRREQQRMRQAWETSESERVALSREVAALKAAQGRPADDGGRIPVGPTVGANTGATTGGGFAGIEGVETIATPGKITVRVPGDVLFSSGSVDLKTTAQHTLDQIAAVLKSQYSTNAVRIEGYTDTDPIVRSHWKDNLELSLQRAASVHRYLAARGVDAKHLYAAGFGDTKPRGSKAQSRRVELVVVLVE
jgi:flagellar motor protein MotB